MLSILPNADMPTLILTIPITYKELDELIHRRLAELNSYSTPELDYHLIDFHTILDTDVSVLAHLYDHYINNTDVRERSESYAAIYYKGINDDIDVFFAAYALPVILDLGTYNIMGLYERLGIVDNYDFYYGRAVFFRDHIVLQVKVVYRA